MATLYFTPGKWEQPAQQLLGGGDPNAVCQTLSCHGSRKALRSLTQEVNLAHCFQARESDSEDNGAPVVLLNDTSYLSDRCRSQNHHSNTGMLCSSCTHPVLAARKHPSFPLPLHPPPAQLWSWSLLLSPGCFPESPPHSAQEHDFSEMNIKSSQKVCPGQAPRM